MSRNIKFRVWDGAKWINIVDTTTLYDLYNPPKGWTFQQFTGLKDKDDKEIYEGDIVELKWFKKTVKTEVKFDSGSFVYVTLDPQHENHSILPHHVEKSNVVKTIVGNIYE